MLFVYRVTRRPSRLRLHPAWRLQSLPVNSSAPQLISALQSAGAIHHFLEIRPLHYTCEFFFELRLRCGAADASFDCQPL